MKPRLRVERRHDDSSVRSSADVVPSGTIRDAERRIGVHSTVDIDDEPLPNGLIPDALPIVERSSYRLLGEVGHGGIGKVHSAHDPRLGRIVAVKELLHANATAEVRFFREASMTQSWMIR